jgi:YfiH family protein
MIKIQIPEFSARNEHFIKHSFFCSVKRSQNLPIFIKDNFASVSFIFPRQSHSNICNEVNKESNHSQECDGLVTNCRDLALCVYTADCVPIVFADCKNGIVGTAHSGWRGAESGIISTTISKLVALGADLKNITVAIGPAISQCNYTVGKMFYQEFMDKDKENQQFFLKAENRIFFDLNNYVKSKIEQSGIVKENIYDCGLDTYINQGIASYRRMRDQDLANDCTNISVIMLKSSQHRQRQEFSTQNNNWLDMQVKKMTSNKIVKKYDLAGAIDNVVTTHHQAGYIDEVENFHPRYAHETEKDQMIKRIKQGRINIEDSLDLHGMTEEQAYHSLFAFLGKAVIAEFRHLLVIVGKGRTGKGVIKANFKHWIESDIRFAKKVLLIEEALPQHGGSGAYYVFLRRSKSYDEVE